MKGKDVFTNIEEEITQTKNIMNLSSTDMDTNACTDTPNFKTCSHVGPETFVLRRGLVGLYSKKGSL